MLKEMIQLLDLYRQAGTKKIGIYALGEKGRLEIQELDLTRGGKIRFRRLRELNERGEGIYFAPKGSCGIVFLDDPKPLCLLPGGIPMFKEELPRGAVIVQTSAIKFQVHIPYVGPPAPRKLRTEFQRLLRERYNSDKGAIDGDQLRRVPGFKNQKYPDRPVVRIIHVVDKGDPLTYEDLMRAVKLRREKESGGAVSSKRMRERHSPPQGSLKCWRDFYDDGDESRADMRYALYLLRMGFSPEEIRRKLLEESLDIENRKRGHLDDYLDRTIRKALMYFG